MTPAATCDPANRLPLTPGGPLSSQPREVPQSTERGETLRVDSERQLRAMCAEILRADHEYPIVGLTCRPGARDPALQVDLVRELIWPSVPIYMIEPQQARAAHTKLPNCLGAYNGAARVWWPGVDESSDPSWHPLVYDSTGVYGEDALRQLAVEFELLTP